METGVYRQRNPRNTPLYQLIENHFDVFCREYEQYARWNPHLHVLTTNGGFDSEGFFHHLPEFPVDIMRWSALIQKVYEVDPLCCPRCGSTMRIIAYIDQWEVILRILKHLKLWPTPQRERVKQRAPPGSRQNIPDVFYTYEFDFDVTD